MNLFTRLAGLFAISVGLSCFNLGNSPPWPGPSAGLTWQDLLGTPDSSDEGDAEIVKQLPVCIAAESWSAGELGKTVLYRYQRDGRTLRVGYFVYWSTERPWGKNVLSYSVLPALFIDAFYSHLFFMFPGAQRFIHGPGDIEGARVEYHQDDEGRWAPVSAVADDGLHREVPLSPGDFVDGQGRVVLMTDVWSHQLGAKGAREFSEQRKAPLTCFGGDTVAPLTAEVARLFRLGSPGDPRRAPPAWRLDAPSDRTASIQPVWPTSSSGMWGEIATLAR
jgi:hypothetical protein